MSWLFQLVFGPKTLPEEQLALTIHFQHLSQIPLFIALDAECGLASRLDKTSVMRFPYNMTMGAADDTTLTYKVGFAVGQQLKLLGVHINFAPVVDVNNNPANPIIGMRSFGSDKNLVAHYGIAYMQGLQEAGIIACAKHFPGHGDTAMDSHEALPFIPHSREHLEETELYPFRKLIQAGVKSVMTAHLEVPELESQSGVPSSLSHRIVTSLLQHTYKFDGLVITLPPYPIETTVAYTHGGDLSQFAESMKSTLTLPVGNIDAIDFTAIQATHVIIALSENYPFHEDSTAHLIRQLKGEGKTVTAVLFCSSYLISFVKEADNIIIAYESDTEAQCAAAEVLCGMRMALGKTPVEIVL